MQNLQPHYFQVFNSWGFIVKLKMLSSIQVIFPKHFNSGSFSKTYKSEPRTIDTLNYSDFFVCFFRMLLKPETAERIDSNTMNFDTIKTITPNNMVSINL